MKAQELNERYQQTAKTDIKLALNELVKSLVRDIGELSTLRKPKTVKANVAILTEVDNKFRAVCRLNPDLKPDGFRQMLVAQIPEIAEIWK